MAKQTRKEYIHDLQVVQQKVTRMGQLACGAVEKSIQALLESDTKLAKEVMQSDDLIDDMIVDIEDYCLLLIAKQQPIAHDLRIIATGFKISTDIERIGDHAFDIARTAQVVRIPLDQERILVVRELADCALLMIRKAMDAYKDKDIEMAEEVCRLDKQMDEIFTRTFYALSDFVTDEASKQNSVTPLLFISRFLERIGDHAVNIAEWVIYLETAQRIHQKKKSS